MKTIYEVSKITGLSRRVIQEYEKAGLAIKPKNKNKYGHLLYGTEEFERLLQLRFYKELGYGKSKIKSIIGNSSYDRKKELEVTVKSLLDQKAKLDNLIAIAQVTQETGIDFNSLTSVFMEDDEDVCFDDVFYILGNIYNFFSSAANEDYCPEDILTKENINTITALFEQIMKFCESGKDASSKEVQNIIASIHEILSQASFELILIFYWIALGLFHNSELATDIDTAYGEGKSTYFYNALQTYFTINSNNALNRLINAIENIENLGRKKYRTDSEEVQLEVEKIHQFWNNISTPYPKTGLDMLRKFGELCGSKACIDAFDHGAKRGIAWFTSRAIQIYCDRLSN